MLLPFLVLGLRGEGTGMEWRKMFLRVPDKVIWAELPEKPLQSVPDKEASKWKTYAGDSDMFKGP